MSKGFRWTLRILVGVIAFAIGARLLWPKVISTNCGGNSAMLGTVQYYVTMASAVAMDAPDQQFNVTAVTPDQRRRISDLLHYRRNAHFLVSTVPFVPRSKEPHRIVIVCDTPYTNVPQPGSPPTHAAGFSDGTTGLISPKEFAALDRSTFVAIDELFPKEKLPLGN